MTSSFTQPLKYDTIKEGGIYEFNVSDTTTPVEILSVIPGQIFNKDSTFLSFKLKDLLTQKEFQVGIEESLLEDLDEQIQKYIFKFYPVGTFLKELI